MSSVPDREVVDLLRDDPDLLAIADAVVATQRVAARPSGGARRVLVAAAVVAVAAAVAVLAPWRGHGTGITGRALAAVGRQPVLHAVLESDVPNESIVSLATGVERPVPQRLEYWYDTDRRLLRAASTVNGRIAFDTLVPRSEPPTPTETRLDPALTAFVSRYRDALRSGEAREVGRGRFDGRRVVWLRFGQRLFGERVGIDVQTYRPVVIEPLDQNGRPATPIWRVASIQTGPYRSRDFKATRGIRRISIGSQLRMITPSRAAGLVGWTPFWLGRSFGSLPLQYTQFQLLIRTEPLPRRTARGVMFSYGRLADRIQLMEAKELERFHWPEQGGAPSPGTAWLRRSTVMGNGPIKHTCQALTRIGGVWVTVEGWNQSSARCIDAARALTRIER